MMALAPRHRLLISSIIALATLIIFYYPTSSLSIAYFHNDDLRLMGNLNDLNSIHTTFNFIFSLENYKFRPVAQLQYVIEHFLFAGNYNVYVLYNICLVLVLNYIFLLFIHEKASLFVCVLLSLVLVTSKYFTYPIWNITGSFETLAAIIFLLIVFFSFSDIKSSKKLIAVLALLLIFTNERYLPFVAALPIIYHYKNSQDNFIVSIWAGIKYSIAISIAYLAFRYASGVPLIVGTQTDNVVDSFSATTFFYHIFQAYLEIFGFSIGPRYLTGFEFASWVPFDALINNSIYIRGLFISLFLLVVSVYYFAFKCYINQKAVLGFNLICLLLIMAGSITFRLELRFLLPSYLMLLLLFSSFRTFDKSDISWFNIRSFDRTLFFTFISLSIMYNFYYAVFFRSEVYFAKKLHDASIITFLWKMLYG